MTQIKLRRDTSANFTSANPILGNGEPAYETDTKKLKIGDGTTAYTQLEYFSAGGSTSINATLPLKIVDGVISLDVDGQTIQIVDGKLHANLDELSNTVNTLSDDVGTSFDLINILQTDVQTNTENITNLQNALSEKQDKIVTLTKEAYDALTEKDPNTIYMIEGETQGGGGDKVTVLSNEYTTISPAPTNGVWYKSQGNGYIVARFMSSSGNQFCQLAINATGTGTLDDNSIYNQTAFSQGNNNGFTLLLPISSTQYYAVNTNFGHGLQWARFIPFITA